MSPAARTAGQMLAAAATATALAVIALLAIARVEWPAYNSSNQLHALTTVGQFFCLAGVFAAGVLWRRGRRLLARIASVVFLSAFSVVTLAMPLGATRLYLFGISVDQQFRTEYLTRLADSPALHDMTYIGLPPYYPAGWFWLGGRLADLTGMPAWEMFKPWAIISITAAIAVALVLWTAMVRFETALAVTTATAAVTLAYTSSEPYAAVITVLLPPVFVLAWSGLKGTNRGALVGAGVFLGVAALFYTLLLAYAAFTITLMALVLAVAGRRIAPLLRLLVVAGISGALALLTWAPYLLAALRGAPADTGTARHYLPMDGAELTFPMLDFTLLGALCMLGTIWLVVHARRSSTAGPLEADAGRRRPLPAPGTARRRRRRHHRPDRWADLQPGHPRRPAHRYQRRLHRHRRLRRPRRPQAARRRAVLPGPRRAHPGSHRPPAERNRRADRRLQLFVLLPLLRVPGPHIPLRKPVGAVRSPLGRHRELGAADHARPVRHGPGPAAVARADGVPDASRRTGQLHPAAGRRRVSQPAQCPALPGVAGPGDLRRPALGRFDRGTVRAGHP
uniref:Membrane protein n=1 Tax=Mycolicibacterium neoaurum TaxID=1795 RepID=H9NJ46_MYCNE|nr:membrane protein [Mycolicibacterium neoaurum]